MSRLYAKGLSAVVALLFCCVAGCGELTDGYVYVDNGGPAAIEVFVDGEQKLTVAPGEVKRMMLKLGEHQFVVKRGDATIYNLSHVLDSGDRPFRRPKYILNPDNSHRYCEVTVKYGEDGYAIRRAQQLQAAYERLEQGNDDGASQVEIDGLFANFQNRVRYEFKEISNNLEVFGDGPFIQFETPHNILKPVASSVREKYGDSAERLALIRVPAKVHEMVTKALQVDNPTIEDLLTLAQAEGELQKHVPVRGM